MAKRKHDVDGAGPSADVASKRKKKNRLREQQEAEQLPAMAILQQEPGVAGEDEFEKGKKNGKKGVEERPVSTPESEKKTKKKIKLKEASPLEDLQPVEHHGSAEPQRKKKKSKDGIPEASTSQIEDDGGAERQRKKKKKTKEVTVTHVVEDNQGNTKKPRKEVVPIVDASPDVQGKKKKTKEVAPTPVTVEASHVEDGQGKTKKVKKEVTVEPSRVEDDQGNKKLKTKEVPVTVDALQDVEDVQGKKKNKMKGVPVTVDALQVVEDVQGKKKKNKTKEVPVTVDALQVAEDDQGKKKKNKTKEVPVTVDALQVAEDDQGKKKKNKTTEVPVTVDALQVVEDVQGKKKKNKTKEVPVTVDAFQVVEDDQGKKKKNTTKEVPVTVDALQVAEDDQGKKKKKKMLKEVAPTPVIEDGQGKKKKTKKVVPTPDVEDGQGKEKEVVTLEVPQTAADGQGKKKKGKVISKDPSVKKTILKSESNGDELDRKKKKKQVTFQLPDRVDDEPLEKELPGEEEIEYNFEELSWKADSLRPGLIYGMYTPEEDGVLKKAIFDYIQEHGWDREEGLEKILNSKSSEARGCWKVIRKCLPKRELKRIHSRAHRLLAPNTCLGKWSNEESRSLMASQAVHGNNWKRIATIVGRDPDACKDKWRQLKYTTSENYKSGSWSEEEHKKLCKLVLKCLHVKAELAEKGLLSKTHRVLRDEISWTFIAEQMDGRSRLDCLNQWYIKMASPMVTTGEWSNFDDERLLARLMEEFPLSEELVEWDSLLENRSGETCKKRWEQMQRTLGRAPAVRHQHFLEKMEGVMKRFAPHLLDPEYDQKFADDMQRADDADESDDADV